jgi:hypothetical protein
MNLAPREGERPCHHSPGVTVGRHICAHLNGANQRMPRRWWWWGMSPLPPRDWAACPTHLWGIATGMERRVLPTASRACARQPHLSVSSPSRSQTRALTECLQRTPVFSLKPSTALDASRRAGAPTSSDPIVDRSPSEIGISHLRPQDTIPAVPIGSACTSSTWRRDGASAHATPTLVLSPR